MIVLPNELLRNYTISIDRDYLGSDVQPTVRAGLSLDGRPEKTIKAFVHIRQGVVEILVNLEDKLPAGTYRALVLDQRNLEGDPIANLKLRIFE